MTAETVGWVAVAVVAALYVAYLVWDERRGAGR